MATYLILNCIVLLALIPGLLLHRKKPSRAWWIALVGLLILTVIFDNIIVGLNIVGYDLSKILGIYVGVAPIEDFFYAIAAMLIVPALWSKGAKHE